MKLISFDVGVKNLSFVIIDDSGIIHHWYNINVQNSKNQCEALIIELNKYLHIFNDCNSVIIEKQPSKNNKMRIIEGLLNAFFIINGSCNQNSLISKVIIYSSAHKLNNFINNNHEFKGKDGYNARKKLSIKLAHKFILDSFQQEHICNVFDSSKKKDDLADCLLQALSFLNIDFFDNNDTSSIISDLKSNIKYILLQNKHLSSDDLKAFIINYSSLHNSILKKFDSLDNCLDIIL